MTVKFEDERVIVEGINNPTLIYIDKEGDLVIDLTEKDNDINWHDLSDARTLGQALIFMADNARVPTENELQLSEIAQMGTTDSLVSLSEYVERIHDVIDEIPEHMKKSFYLEKLMAVRSEEE